MDVINQFILRLQEVFDTISGEDPKAKYEIKKVSGEQCRRQSHWQHLTTAYEETPKHCLTQSARREGCTVSPGVLIDVVRDCL